MRYWKQVALLALIVFAVALAPQSADAQTGKIGVINTNQVLAESAAGVAAGAEFNAFATERQQPLVDLDTEITVKTQQLEAQQLALSESALATRASEIDRLQRAFTRAQEDLEFELQAKQAEVLEPVYALANQVIEDYATEQGFQMIIDPTAAQGLLVYMDAASDVTLEVISRMDTSYAANAGGSTSAPASTTEPAAGAAAQ